MEGCLGGGPGGTYLESETSGCLTSDVVMVSAGGCLRSDMVAKVEE